MIILGNAAFSKKTNNQTRTRRYYKSQNENGKSISQEQTDQTRNILPKAR